MTETKTTEQYVTDTHLAKRLATEILTARRPRWAGPWTWTRPQTPSRAAIKLVSEWLLKEFEAFTAANPAASTAQVAEWKRHLAHGHVRGITLLARATIAPVIASEENERKSQIAWERAHDRGPKRTLESGLERQMAAVPAAMAAVSARQARYER